MENKDIQVTVDSNEEFVFPAELTENAYFEMIRADNDEKIVTFIGKGMADKVEHMIRQSPGLKSVRRMTDEEVLTHLGLTKEQFRKVDPKEAAEKSRKAMEEAIEKMKASAKKD